MVNNLINLFNLRSSFHLRRTFSEDLTTKVDLVGKNALQGREWNEYRDQRAQDLIFGKRCRTEFTEEEKKLVDAYQKRMRVEDVGALPNTQAAIDEAERNRALRNSWYQQSETHGENKSASPSISEAEMEDILLNAKR